MRAALALILSTALGGCVIHAGPPRHRPPSDHRVVVIPAGHVHDAHCGHYWHNGNWHHFGGHVHGDGCGHPYHGGRWVHAAELPVEHGHKCVAGCSHYHHGGKWYVMQGHAHGHGCGHALKHGHWVVVD